MNAGLVVVSGEDLASRVYFAQNRLGGVLAPAECDAVRRGIQTLALRMDRQQENANAIARYLLVHPLVKAVHTRVCPAQATSVWLPKVSRGPVAC